MKDLAEAILLQRRILKASQSEVAKAAGVSRNYISQIERGDFGGLTINTLHKICRALNLQAEINIYGVSNTIPRETRPTLREPDKSHKAFNAGVFE